MAVLKLVRYRFKSPDQRAVAEGVMHELATYVRGELPGVTWTAYRDARTPTQYLAFVRADDAAADARYQAAPGLEAFHLVIAPLLAGPAEITECELVTSSDLAPRPRARRR